jgi:hypothetical protein
VLCAPSKTTFRSILLFAAAIPRVEFTHKRQTHGFSHGLLRILDKTAKNALKPFRAKKLFAHRKCFGGRTNPSTYVNPRFFCVRRDSQSLFCIISCFVCAPESSSSSSSSFQIK